MSDVECDGCQNGIVPEWEWVIGLGFVEDFMGLGWGRSSILGIDGMM